MKLQKSIDKEKEKMIVKLAMGLSISRPSILLHSGDDWCWLQYYAVKFLERNAYVFIDIVKKDKIKIVSDELITVKYYESHEELMRMTKEVCDEYVQKIMKVEKGIYDREKSLL